MPYNKQADTQEGSFLLPSSRIQTSQLGPGLGLGQYSEHGAPNNGDNPYLVGRPIQERNEWKDNLEKSYLQSIEQGTYESIGMPIQREEIVRERTCKDAGKDELVVNNNAFGLDAVVDDCVQIKYCVEGLSNYELAVKGIHVDERILPGFKYRVRTLGLKNRYLLNGKALHLINIGQGYGKRLTFESNLHNMNTNYFWSDSSDKGYGFSIVAVEHGDKFTVCSLERRPIGHAVIEDVDPSQIELHSEVIGKNITKEVSLRMRCRVRYTCEPHGMMSLRADEMVLVSGLAVVTKSQNQSKAITELIKNIELMSIGPCLFVKEQ
ncbi:uncharacterized protein LOC117119746 [Anneissia japonica]|uniref:uncharacterized protein LOC117119746 n=1 Tax=Anneissia japonica TaxID=1529436 RepID=UPI0014259F87|nr:uncharacterized protein LOC117119746 [Anneissia japonica]